VCEDTIDEAWDRAQLESSFSDRDEVRAFLARSGALVTASEGRLRDVCEGLRRARALLEREHAKYVDVVEGEATAMLITDRRASVRDANRAAAAMFGVEQKALPGRLLVSFVARQDVVPFRGFARRLLDASRDADEERSVVLRVRPRGGAVVRARLSVGFVRTIDRKKVSLRWTIRPEGGTP
jgi:PAS domain S-box-containing protein